LTEERRGQDDKSERRVLHVKKNFFIDLKKRVVEIFPDMEKFLMRKKLFIWIEDANKRLFKLSSENAKSGL